MPETRGEWLLFLAGLLVIGALVAAIVLRPKSSDPTSATEPTTASVPTTTAYTPPPAPPATTAADTTSTQTVGTTTTTSATTTASTASTSELKVTARDDTWLSIRRSSATGAVLFEGTLAKGDSRTYSATAFHVRFGAAANVSATLNGKPLALPGGTYSATITRSGLGSRSA